MPYSNVIRLPVQDAERMTDLIGIKYSPYQKSIFGSVLGFFSDELRGGLTPEHFKKLNKTYANAIFLVPGVVSLVDTRHEELQSKLARTVGPKQGIIQVVEKALNEDNSLRFSIIPTHNLSINNTKDAISEHELDEAISIKCFYHIAQKPTTFFIPYLNTQYDSDGRIIKPPYPEFGTHANTNFSPRMQNHLFIRFQGFEAYVKDFNDHFPDLNNVKLEDIIEHARNFKTTVDSYVHRPVMIGVTTSGYELDHDFYEATKAPFKLTELDIAAISWGLRDRNLDQKSQDSSLRSSLINFAKQPQTSVVENSFFSESLEQPKPSEKPKPKNEAEQFAEALNIDAGDIKSVEPTALGQGLLIILKTTEAADALEAKLRKKLETNNCKLGEYIRFLGTGGFPSNVTTTRLEVWGKGADALDDYLSSNLDRNKMQLR